LTSITKGFKLLFFDKKLFLEDAFYSTENGRYLNQFRPDLTEEGLTAPS